MPVINFQFEDIHGARERKSAQQVKANTNVSLISMKKESKEGIGDYLHVNFRFEIEYDPGIGKISFEGFLWYRGNLKEKLEETDDSITISSDIFREISTHVIRRSLIESFGFLEKLNLPSPIQLPQVSTKEEIPNTLEFQKE